VREAGFEPWMSAAAAAKQDWVAALAQDECFGDLAADPDWREYADRMLAGGRSRGQKSA
jgi:hypothetical protein